MAFLFKADILDHRILLGQSEFMAWPLEVKAGLTGRGSQLKKTCF